MTRTYPLRLKPTKDQCFRLTELLEHLCVLYNSALDHRKKSWQQSKKTVTLYDQQKALIQFRQSSPEVSEFPASIQRDPLRRIDRAFNSFFRRVKAKENPGYPRYKAKTQYDSFEVDIQNFRFEGNTIILRKMGGFRFKTKAKIKGTPKVVRISRQGRHWIANVVCNLGEDACI